jgi:quercetin dioxygenase-like cupin family protein
MAVRDDSRSPFADIAELSPHRIWDGVVGRVVESEGMSFSVIELEPDTLVPEHRHVNEQVGVLVQGAMEFRVGEETRSLGPGATWRIPANVPHEVRSGPDGAIAVEAFAPRRADWEALPREEPSAPRWPAG